MQTLHDLLSDVSIRAISVSAPLRTMTFVMAMSCVGLSGCATKTPLADLFGTSPSDQTATATTESTPVGSPSTSPAGVPTDGASISAVHATAHGSGAQTTGAKGLRGFLGIFAPYRITIQQGNFVSSEMLTQLKIGMTQDQVRFALGTPLLDDIFHKDRWDYLFRLQRGNGEITTSRVTVFFKDNHLASYEGGDLPTEAEYLARIAGAAPPSKPLPALVAPVTAPSSAVTK